MTEPAPQPPDWKAMARTLLFGAALVAAWLALVILVLPRLGFET